MPAGQNQGLVQTVLGPVPPSELGPTTTHEHLCIDFTFMYRPARDFPRPELADAPITLENLGWVRYNYYSNRPNMQLTDVDTAINEVAMYRDAGGGAIVEATTIGIGRAPEALVRISRATGVHVVMGAGFYVDAVHPADMAQRTVEDLARQISADITQGVAGSGIKAGIIGEMGCTWPLTVERAQDAGRGGARAAGDRRGDLDPSGTPSRRARRNPGGPGERRRRHLPRDHGAPGPHRVRVRRRAADRRVGLLPRMGSVRQ